MRPRTLVGRLVAWQVGVVLLILAALGILLDRSLDRQSVRVLTQSLAAQARTIQVSLPPGDDIQDVVTRLARAGEVRVTVIREDGTVIAESEADPGTLESHADRPEVQAALAGRVGVASRRSETLGVELLYVALPPMSDRIVRVASPLERIRERRAATRVVLSLGLLLAALAAGVGAALAGRGVVRPLRRMTEALSDAPEAGPAPRMEPSGLQELDVLAVALNAAEARLETQTMRADDQRGMRDLILSSMEEGVMLAGADATITFANSAVARHLGSPPPNLAALTPPALRDAAVAARTTGTGTAVEVETGFPSRWLRGSFIPVGRDGSLLIVIRDVTQARRLEAVRRDFVTNASHELKTPVASIQAAAETIVDAAEDDPEVVPRFARVVEREAVRLSRIVSDLLDLSRLETELAATDRIELDQIVRDEADRFAEPTRPEPELSVTIQPATVRGSERDLRLLVRNLVDNALRYTVEGGRVDVRLRQAGREAVLTVTDTGIGIPSRDLPRVFERFYRVDRARSRETGGTGLGLSIVKHVAENHGGRVTVESELGRGTTFEVRLPLADD